MINYRASGFPGLYNFAICKIRDFSNELFERNGKFWFRFSNSVKQLYWKRISSEPKNDLSKYWLSNIFLTQINFSCLKKMDFIKENKVSLFKQNLSNKNTLLRPRKC